VVPGKPDVSEEHIAFTFKVEYQKKTVNWALSLPSPSAGFLFDLFSSDISNEHITSIFSVEKQKQTVS
jgi:hypothetical protein